MKQKCSRCITDITGISPNHISVCQCQYTLVTEVTADKREQNETVTTIEEKSDVNKELLNPENKCSHLFSQEVDLSKISIDEMFKMQKSLQDHLASNGRALAYDAASFMQKIQDISVQWRNMNLEMGELLERLPYKEWKTYTTEQKSNFTSEEQRLEVLYEYIDVFHFFMNVGLALGIDGETFRRLYATKNKENFDRQAKGY